MKSETIIKYLLILASISAIVLFIKSFNSEEHHTKNEMNHSSTQTQLKTLSIVSSKKNTTSNEIIKYPETTTENTSPIDDDDKVLDINLVIIIVLSFIVLKDYIFKDSRKKFTS